MSAASNPNHLHLIDVEKHGMSMAHPYLLKMTKAIDPADKFIEEGLLSLISSSRPSKTGTIVSSPEGASSLESVQAGITFSKCLVRFLIHFVKGCAVGTGMYVTDYMLVNGHFGRLLAAINEFFNGNGSSADFHIFPSSPQ